MKETSPLAPLHVVERGTDKDEGNGWGREKCDEDDMKPDRIILPDRLQRKMVEAARELRRNPTPSEEILWEALRGKRCNGIKFRRQHPIGPYVVDFYAPSLQLVIEVDGSIHNGQQETDRDRQMVLETLGLTCIRFSANQVETDLDSVISAIVLKAEDLLLPFLNESPPPVERGPASGARRGRGAGGEVFNE